LLESGEIVKFLASFSIIIVFIYSIYYYINRAGFKLTAKNGKNIKILETHYFSKNRGFILVKVKNSLFFLSLDENGIKKLKEWEENDSDGFKAMSDEFKRAENEKKQL